ncbi:hypothetical protein D9M70_575080 [compost metagenome]
MAEQDARGNRRQHLDIEMTIERCLAARFRGLVDNHDILHWTQSGVMPGLPGQFPMRDSSGCHEDVICNGRANSLRREPSP